MSDPDGYAVLPIPLNPGPSVYRFWNAEGECLYVGMSRAQRLFRRIGAHMLDTLHKTKWWKDVVRVDRMELADEEAAQVEERRQIYLQRPIHNKVNNCGHDLSLPENYEPKGRPLSHLPAQREKSLGRKA